jgi:hypothetical protein
MGLFKSSTPTVNSGEGALPAGRDTTGRRVPSEPPYTYTETAPRETHRITPSGSVPRTGTTS